MEHHSNLINVGELEMSDNYIGVGEISYNRINTKKGIYSIYLGDHVLIAVPKGITFENITFKKTKYFVSSDFACFAFLDPSRIPLIGPLPIEGPPQYTLVDEICEPISRRNSLFDGMSKQCETTTKNTCIYQIIAKNHHYHSIWHKKDRYSEIFMDGKLWMIYAFNRVGDGALPIYRAITPIKGAYAFMVQS